MLVQESTTVQFEEKRVTGIVALLDMELARRGVDWAWLSRETGLAESTFSKWKREKHVVPDLPTLARIRAATGISMRQLVEACGIPVDEPGVGETEKRGRAEALVRALPWLEEYADRLASLDPEDRRAIEAMIEGYLKGGRRRRS